MATLAVPAVTMLGNAFKKKFGYYPKITWGYRSFDEQVKLHDEFGYPKAAVPGTSNHGWGLAFDFGSGIDKYNSPQWKWMNKWGRDYGFRPLNENNLAFEPWHWGYFDNLNLYKEDDMFNDEDRAMLNSLGEIKFSYQLDGAKSVWIALPGTSSRLYVDSSRYEKLGKPEIIKLPATDDFWKRDIANDRWGEVFKKPENAKYWLLNKGAMYGVSAVEWAAHGADAKNLVTTVDPTNDIWTVLPQIG